MWLDWVILIASFILQFILIPKPQNAKPASLDDFDVPVVEEGKELGVLSGTEMLKGPNVTWWGDLKIKAIKGKRRYIFFGPRATIGYYYFLGMQMVLCTGPADELLEIWIGDKLAWSGNCTGGQIFIAQEDLFGGKEKEGGIAGLVDVCMGGPGQGRNDYLAQESVLGANCPAYRGVTTVVLRQVYVGTTPYIKNWAFKVRRIHLRSDNSQQWSDGNSCVPDGPSGPAFDMNPAHIIREYLTDKMWGMGYNDADIDAASFNYAAQLFYSEYFGLTIYWVRQEQIEEMITIVLSHVNAVLYTSRTTGMFILKPVRNDYDTASLPIFDEDDVIEWSEVKRRQPVDAISSITVQYTERRKNTSEDGSATYHNDAQIQQSGGVILDNRSYPGISRNDLAMRVAERDQHPFNQGMIDGQLTGKRTLSKLNPGDPFRLVSARQNLDGEIMRVVDIKFAGGKENTISIKFIHDQFRLGTAALFDDSEEAWAPPGSTPQPVDPRLAWELPYAEATNMLGVTDTNNALASNPNFGMLGMAGEEPTSDTITVFLYVDGVQVENLDAFAPAGFLRDDLDALTTSITISAANEFEALQINMLAVLVETNPRESEVIRIQTWSGNDLVISRGMLDTIPRAHVHGTPFIVYDAFMMSDFVSRTAGAAPFVKMLSQTIKGTLDYGAAPGDTVTMASRAIRPLRPANVKVQGAPSGPVNVGGLPSISVSFATRNRLSETTVYKAWTEAAVTPEAGQTVIIEVLNPTRTAVVTSHTGITASPFSVPLTSFGGNQSGWIRVGALRGGYREWAAYEINVLIYGLMPAFFVSPDTFYPVIITTGWLEPPLFIDPDTIPDSICFIDIKPPSFANFNTFYEQFVEYV